MAYKRKRSRIGKPGCLFWLFILLVIVVIFIFRGKGNIKESFAFLKKIHVRKQEEPLKPQEDGTGRATAQKPQGTVSGGELEKESPRIEKEPLQENTPVEKKPQARRPGQTGSGGTVSRGTQDGASTGGARPKGEIKSKKRTSSLYFVRIDSENGSVKPVLVERTVEYKDSPITKTFEALLNGPSEAERKKGLMSLVPDQTKLLAARIENGHLTLDFSHHFEENYTGREAILMELAQVVLTSFDFEQVSSLSILIEGSKKRYITGEGIPIKEEYTKQDLPSLRPDG